MVTIFHVTHFYIIESLRMDDLKTGSQLANEVFKFHQFRGDVPTSELMQVDNKAAFFKALEWIAIVGRTQNVKPFIHFEIHGSKSGLELGNGDFVPWKDLYSHLVTINTTTSNNLFITLATCYGAQIAKVFDITNRAPFAWYIGPISTVTTDEIYADYTIFFDTLLTSFDINTALDAMSSQGKDLKYMFYSAEAFYTETFEHWLSGY